MFVINMRGRFLLISLFALLLIASAYIFIVKSDYKNVGSASSYKIQLPVLIIDAGHGGEDGGAVSDSGVPESWINLNIAQKTNAIMGLFGAETVMTRTDDISLHSDDARTLSQKKKSDLKNRVNMINRIENGVLISIHQNSFTDGRYSGAQVFFIKNDENSMKFAKITQEIMKNTLDTGNTRQAAKISDDVYLMNNVKCLAILVECGFMSNAGEAKLLMDNGYQNRIASAIAASFFQFQKNGDPVEGTKNEE